MYFDAILLSLVQAITEFFPISSSGHLVLLHQVLPLGSVDVFRFDIAVHWGTLIALLVVFWKDLWRYFHAWLVSLRRRSLADADARFAWYLLAGTIPAAILGALLESAARDTLRSPVVVVVSLILGGLLLFVADRYARRERTLTDVTLMDALLIGTSQALAFIPGISRSGITIITALARKMKREDAVRFSFLLSVPIVFAAGMQQLLALDLSTVSTGERTTLLVGVVTAALAGIAVIRFFLRYVAKRTFSIFVVYRIVLALGVLVAILF